MKEILITIIVTFVLSLFIANVVKYVGELNEKNKKRRQNEICCEILNEYSIMNAIVVNKSLSSRNSPIRPDGELFFDGIIKEIDKGIDPSLPECKIINIRRLVSNSIGEDTNGTTL